MIADQYIGNGRTAGLTGIPCLKDRVHMLICPGKRNRTSREVDEYDGSAGLMKAPQKLLLKLRELDLDAVSTDKAFIIHRHGLAFELTRNTADKNDCIGGLSRCHGSLDALINRGRTPFDGDHHRPVSLGVFEPQGERCVIRKAPGDANLSLHVLLTWRRRPRVDEGFSVHDQAETSTSCHDELILTLGGGQELTIPPCRHAAIRDTRRHAPETLTRAQIKVQRTFGSASNRLARQRGIIEVLAMKPA